MRIEIEGLDELNDAIKAAADKLSPDVIEPILVRAADDVAGTVRNRTPVGPTGNLRRSIIAKPLKRRGLRNAIGVGGGDSTAALAGVDYRIGPHAHLVEFGTVKMTARPFFEPAVESRISDVSAQIMREIGDAAQEAWKK